MTKVLATRPGAANEELCLPNQDFVPFVEGLLQKWHVPGVSVAVIDGNRTWTKGLGTAEFPSTAFSASTLSYSGSTTKAHVAALIGLLIESGNYTNDSNQPLGWKTPISSLIRDDFVLQDEWATANITLEDALCHRTGIAKHDNAYLRYVRPEGFEGPRRIITLREMTRNLRELPMASSPRTTFCYSNLMFATLSHVVEVLTGQWLGDALRQWLWEPLQMRSTYLSLDHALAGGHVARGYFWDTGADKYTAFERMPTEEVAGSGAVIMSAEDVAKWMQFWIEEKLPLSQAGHSAIKRPNIVIGAGHDAAPYDSPIMYAMGWQTSSYRGHRFWTHHGGMDAFGAQITFFPSLRFGVAFMGNTAFTTNGVAEMSTWHLIDTKLGVPRHERFDWDRKWNNAVQQIKDTVCRGLHIIAPNRPSPPLTPSLPLHEYAGLYYHPGYRYLNIEVIRGDDQGSTDNELKRRLRANLHDNNFRVKCDFAHISGENWIMYVDLMDAPTLTMHGFGAVQFRVGADGRVDSMGIEWRARTDIEGWIWYKRVRRGKEN